MNEIRRRWMQNEFDRIFDSLEQEIREDMDRLDYRLRTVWNEARACGVSAESQSGRWWNGWFDSYANMKTSCEPLQDAYRRSHLRGSIIPITNIVSRLYGAQRR